MAGRPDPLTGYLCNIALLDEVARREALGLINDLLARHGWQVRAEAVLPALWRRLGPCMPPASPLVELELCLTPHLRYSTSRENPSMILLTQQFEFAAAHRLHCPQLSDEENRRTFGKCNNPNGHGHNYVLEVTVAGMADRQGGTVLPLPRLEQIVRERVIDRLDHKHLNADTAEFADRNPSVENIARVIWDLLVGQVAPARLHRVRVWETAKTWAEYDGQDQA